MRRSDPGARALSNPFTLRRFQNEALEAIRAGLAKGRTRVWVSLPPGAGKTVLGTELIAERERPAVVFCPNTAIQSQWLATWGAYRRGAAGTTRSLDHPVTVLTYQALASFDDGDGEAEPDSLVDRLHENGRALVAALHDAGPITVILDECHHLLEVWGALLTEVLDELDDAIVLGLTATPPSTVSARQAEQLDGLFGDLAYAASIPAAVREGDLAPFAELAWLTEPSGLEREWLRSSAERFVELTTALLDPNYGSVPILHWFDRRFTALPVSWATFERTSPDLARAALKLSHAGLVAQPDGSRLREEHRLDLSAEDWAVLIDDWVTECIAVSGDPLDDAVLADLRAALPGIGYQVSTRGVSAIASVVDRVVSRSESKMAAAAQILTGERAVLADRLRSVVICDFERAAATSAAALRDAPPQYGSAFQVLVAMREAGVSAVLVTGRTVALEAELAADLLAFVRERSPGRELTAQPVEGLEGIVEIVGAWTSRAWVPQITAYLEAGRIETLVGTRALLGEGWDAAGINVLIDLSAAATPSAVIQTRGRALRRDPSWADKVAITWSVVCVAADHPGGDTDWRRFVRKHQGYFGVDDDGEVVSGVAHVDARFSPFAPPDGAEFRAINETMLLRSTERPAIARRWRVGEPYADRVVPTLRIRPTADARPVVPPSVQLTGEPVPWARMGASGPVWTRSETRVRRRPWAAAREVAREYGIMVHAWIVAEALAALRGGAGAEAVAAVVDAQGAYRLRMNTPDDAVAAAFTEAVDELLAPIATPRYLVARHTPPAASRRSGWAVLFGRHRPVARTWYPMPAEFARTKAGRAAFAEAWRRWIGPGDMVDTRTPEGEAALLACAGLAAESVHSVVRSAWS